MDREIIDPLVNEKKKEFNYPDYTAMTTVFISSLKNVLLILRFKRSLTDVKFFYYCYYGKTYTDFEMMSLNLDVNLKL